MTLTNESLSPGKFVLQKSDSMTDNEWRTPPPFLPSPLNPSLPLREMTLIYANLKDPRGEDTLIVPSNLHLKKGRGLNGT